MVGHKNIISGAVPMACKQGRCGSWERFCCGEHALMEASGDCSEEGRDAWECLVFSQKGISTLAGIIQAIHVRQPNPFSFTGLVQPCVRALAVTGKRFCFACISKLPARQNLTNHSTCVGRAQEMCRWGCKVLLSLTQSS